MVNYKIVTNEKEETKTINVKLRKNMNGNIVLCVGRWDVFELKTNGKGCLVGGIPPSDAFNKEGLLIECSKLVLEKN